MSTSTDRPVFFIAVTGKAGTDERFGQQNMRLRVHAFMYSGTNADSTHVPNVY